MRDNQEFCKCKNRPSVYSEEDDWGYWLVCAQCRKPIEDSYTYFNHYDGEDHCDDD
ncbi:hypothetical protein [Clostridium tyrobutyricum]|uniref:hypothetical protein n=1 Tax=Clostridium tyrobutyricum TaxID=1519 RepID=UPI000B330CBE|nr:hypothetical protein [Clostridium tyrobutyricum]